jgi:hypothetical protein
VGSREFRILLLSCPYALVFDSDSPLLETYVKDVELHFLLMILARVPLAPEIRSEPILIETRTRLSVSSPIPTRYIEFDPTSFAGQAFHIHFELTCILFLSCLSACRLMFDVFSNTMSVF